MLRNIKNLFGYKIHAKYGNIGEVYDFFLDDETWAIRYLVADVENLAPGSESTHISGSFWSTRVGIAIFPRYAHPATGKKQPRYRYA